MMRDAVMDVVFLGMKAVSVVDSRESGKKERSKSKWLTRAGVVFCMQLRRYCEKSQSVHQISGLASGRAGSYLVPEVGA